MKCIKLTTTKATETTTTNTQTIVTTTTTITTITTITQGKSTKTNTGRREESGTTTLGNVGDSSGANRGAQATTSNTATNKQKK